MSYNNLFEIPWSILELINAGHRIFQHNNHYYVRSQTKTKPTSITSINNSTILATSSNTSPELFSFIFFNALIRKKIKEKV